MSALLGFLKNAVLPPRHLPLDGTTHATYLAISILFVALPFALSCPEKPDVPLRLGSMRLPPLCASKMAGFDCPGCGLTHSFVYLAHGQARESVRWHRIGILLYAYFALQIVIRGWVLRRKELRDNVRLAALQYYSSAATIFLLLGNWLLGLALGGNGS